MARIADVLARVHCARLTALARRRIAALGGTRIAAIARARIAALGRTRSTVLGALVLALVVALGVTQSVWAAGEEPGAPKLAGPRGSDSTFHFNDYGPSPSDDVVLRWDEQALAAIRATNPAPAVAARALAIVHTAMYDAWAPYDATAVGTRTGAGLRRPADERTANYKSAAMSYAAYRALLDLFPSQASNISGFMTALGYDKNDGSTDTTTPQGIGNVAAAAVLEFRHHDGSNQLGDLNGGAPYSDWTGYQPVNTWSRVNDLYHWQPLCVPLPKPGATTCTGTVQKFATPQWGRVTPFALTRADQFPPPPVDRGELVAEARDLVATQAFLEDKAKTIVYYWADGPGSETPAGHWAMIAAAASRAAGTSLDGNVKLFFALSNALLDASIATWNSKRVNDSVRPITFIRQTYAGKTIKGWAGPGKGVVQMDGSNWIPYQEPGSVTPPFPEYTSGHSGFSAASAQVFTRFAGTDVFKAALSVTVPAGTSTIEPKLVPKDALTLTFKSFMDAAESAGESRLYGGIHFGQADVNGRAMGAQVGDTVWAKASTYFNGTAEVPTPLPTTTGTASPGTSTSPTATVSPTTTTSSTATVSPTTSTSSTATVSPTTSTSPTATASPTTSASSSATASPTATVTPDLAQVQSAVSDLSAGIREQVSSGQLLSSAGTDVQGKVDKILAYAKEGDWATARYYADQVRIKLGKYLTSGAITATGYQALIPKVDVVDAALA